jgi:hypothetical protein
LKWAPTTPQRLKPHGCVVGAARLKPCPDEELRVSELPHSEDHTCNCGVGGNRARRGDRAGMGRSVAAPRRRKGWGKTLGSKRDSFENAQDTSSRERCALGAGLKSGHYTSGAARHTGIETRRRVWEDGLGATAHLY